MPNLFGKSPVGHQRELYQVVANGLGEALEGKSSQFFFNIDIYLDKVPEVRKEMATRGFSRLLELIQAGSWSMTSRRLANLSEDYLSIFCALEDFVSVGVDMDSEGFPTAIYTRSIQALADLKANGQLEGDIDKAVNMLVGAKTEKSVRDENFVAVRLDLIGTKEGKPVFKPVVPRSNLDIGGGKRYVFIPVPFYYIFENILTRWASNSPFKVFYSGTSSITAVNSDVVRRVYSGSADNLVESKLTKVHCGYDASKKYYFAYNLESSLHSVGETRFRPELLDAVKQISESEINKSIHNINFQFLRGIYRTSIQGSKTNELDSLHVLDLSSYANLHDKMEALLELEETLSDKDLYWLMKSNQKVFGNIETKLEKRERVSPKFLKVLKHVQLPTSELERLTLINSLMRKGVVKFTATTKEGNIFERTCSNNQDVLERMLGKNYVMKYESVRNKLYHVRRLLFEGKVKTKYDLEKLGVEYNILDYVDPRVYFSDAIKYNRTEDAIETIDSAIEKMNQKVSTYAKSDKLLYRDLYLTNKFFGSVDVNNIISLDYAEVK